VVDDPESGAPVGPASSPASAVTMGPEHRCPRRARRRPRPQRLFGGFYELQRGSVQSFRVMVAADRMVLRAFGAFFDDMSRGRGDAASRCDAPDLGRVKLGEPDVPIGAALAVGMGNAVNTPAGVIL
jgi:hypothetical protein